MRFHASPPYQALPLKACHPKLGLNMIAGPTPKHACRLGPLTSLCDKVGDASIAPTSSRFGRDSTIDYSTPCFCSHTVRANKLCNSVKSHDTWVGALGAGCDGDRRAAWLLLACHVGSRRESRDGAQPSMTPRSLLTKTHVRAMKPRTKSPCEETSTSIPSQGAPFPIGDKLKIQNISHLCSSIFKQFTQWHAWVMWPLIPAVIASMFASYSMFHSAAHGQMHIVLAWTPANSHRRSAIKLCFK
eukprot:3094281-Amphidinium_carterae.1